MALGLFGGPTEKVEVQDDTKKSTSPSGYSYDPESNNGTGNRRMARIVPLPTEKGASADDSSSGSFTVGKQIELEAANAIQYRTCSWPKVCLDASRRIVLLSPEAPWSAVRSDLTNGDFRPLLCCSPSTYV
jgi:hypothetical protein